MKITIRTDGFEAAMERSLARAKKLAAREKVQPSRTITFESPEALLEALSVERVRLCEIARTGTFSISSLAAALGRDPKSVRRDVLKLVRVGVLRTRKESNPGHGQVRIVEPVAKRFDIRASF